MLLQFSDAIGLSKELQLGIVGFILIVGIFGLVRLIIVMDKRYNKRMADHQKERQEFYSKMELISDKSNKIHKEIHSEQTTNMNRFADAISRMEGMFISNLKK
jgi:hypothetical protein